MAKYYVKILEANGCGPPPPPWPGEAMLNPDLLGEANGKAWELLCTSVVDLARASQRSAIEIYICLTGESLLAGPDRASLRRLLEAARNHAWGAKLFVVASSQLDLRRAAWWTRDSREMWMKAALEGRVEDILVVDYDPMDPSTVSCNELRSAADAAANRQTAARALRRLPGPWRCVVDPQMKVLESFLSTWLHHEESTPDANLVIVIDEVLRQVAALKRARRRYPHSRCAVATLREWHPDLERHCESEDLLLLGNAAGGAPPGAFFSMRSELQLWYFMLRLNEEPATRRAAAPSAQAQAEAGSERLNDRLLAVTVTEAARVFEPVAPAAEPVIVITSAFNADEPRQCYEAAMDVGSFVARYPAGLSLIVEPAVTLGRLFQLLDQVPKFHVWVHLGHGDGVLGLRDNNGDLAPPADWLRVFELRDSDLTVAILLTCESAAVARLFAEAGLPLAIGFEREVQSDLSRELAVEVLDSIIAHWPATEQVFWGFRRGYRRITVQEQVASRPIAYYAALSV